MTLSFPAFRVGYPVVIGYTGFGIRSAKDIMEIARATRGVL